MFELPLKATGWLEKDQALIPLAEELAGYCVSKLPWQEPGDSKIKPGYRFMSAWQSEDRSSRAGLDLRNLANARKQATELKPVKIGLSCTAQWLNPYIVSEDVYDSWGVYLYLQRETTEEGRYALMLNFYISNLWFAAQEYAALIFDSYGSVEDYKEKGYRLNAGEKVFAREGQSYVPEQARSRENRQRVIEGLASIIKDYSLLGATLTYAAYSKFDWERSEIAISDSILFEDGSKYDPLMYYTSPGTSISQSSLTPFGATFFEKDIEGRSLNLETEHFDFLRGVVPAIGCMSY